ncbi:1-(5-phosphoribosyl)-5-((5-phosphoribosylamino)methylideneamino)imidazole-4-carboxamide isomerase, partial [Acinetobacter bohemicus]
MQIIPAIDLKGGCAVRLTQGKMESAKVYYKNPLEVAKLFWSMGAEYLHIVDLDGAFRGEPKNREVIEKIAKHSKLKIEVGGGIRDEKTIQEYLEIGVNRVILGSIALKNPDFAKEMAQKYPIVIGIDAKEGRVATEG